MIAALVGFALAFAESGLGLGVIVPGELAISSLAALAHGPGDTLALGGAVALGATAGDHLGYVVGRRGGVRLRDSRAVARVGVGRWDRAAHLVQRFGFWAMLASRLLPIIRTVMPVVAGSAGLRYRSFLLALLLGAVAWSALWVGAGAVVANSGVLDHPKRIGAVLAIGLIVMGARRLLQRRPGAGVIASPVGYRSPSNAMSRAVSICSGSSGRVCSRSR